MNMFKNQLQATMAPGNTGMKENASLRRNIREKLGKYKECTVYGVPNRNEDGGRVSTTDPANKDHIRRDKEK